MAKKIDLNTIAKEYAEGRISREDFLYLHKMLTDPASNQAGSQQKATPPVLKPAPGVARKPKPQPAQQTRRSVQQRRPVSAATQASHRTAATADLTASFSGNRGNRSVLGYIKSHHKEVVALLGTLGIFISMFYNKFDTTDPDTDSARVVVASQTQQDKSSGIRTQDLKLIAQLMMEGNSWNPELIDDFIAQWNRLSKQEKQTVKTTQWYDDFGSMLARQIKTTRIKASTGDVAAIYDQQTLLSLADTLIFGNDPKARTLLSEEVKAAKIALKEDDKEHEPASRIQPKEPPEAPVKQQKEKEPEPVTAKASDRDIAKRPIAARHRISRTEIEDVINRFTVAFEAGHTRDLLSLFADADYSSSFASLNSVKKDYQELIRSSKERKLDLDSFFWEHDYGEIRGTARYRANVKMANSNINKTITGDLNITIRRLLGKNYITNFKLNNKKVVSKTTNPDFLPRDKKQFVADKGKPEFPTPAELQDLVTQYVTAYETGDVTELMHLFANATWTKSRTGLVEMKQNYDNLFATTSGREIFIKNVEWKVKGKKAMGTGDLLLTHHTDNDQVLTKKGKIRIVATKIGDSVRFSQMFHIVE